jgi:hypothetical protein
MSALLRLYPRSWRDRYEEEFLWLLEARPPTLRDRVDIVRGAVEARLDHGAPDRTRRPARVAATSAIAAGSLWIAWLVISIRALDSLDPDPVRDLGRVLSMFAGLAALASHVSLGVASLDRLRAWGGVATSMAAVGFLFSAFGGGAAALIALLGSIGLATAVAGRTVSTIVAALWLLATAGVFAAFAGLAWSGWTDPSVMYLAIPYGIVWILIGVTIAVRGVPVPIADGQGARPEG